MGTSNQERFMKPIVWRTACAAVLSGALILANGCGKSDSATTAGASSSSSASGSASAVSPMDKKAQAAVMAEIQKRFIKSADGWITARTSGAPTAPDHYLREFKQIAIHGSGPDDLSESDKLNGFEWSGDVSFEKTPIREAGDPGIVLEATANVMAQRPRGQWSQWVDYELQPIHVQKVKGQWQVNTDTLLLSGEMPTANDFAKAGVKQ
jgi:hypothetical protein